MKKETQKRICVKMNRGTMCVENTIQIQMNEKVRTIK